MKRASAVLAFTALVALAALAPGCGCSVKGGEGSQAIDVTMGGHLMKDSLLSFQAEGYANQQLTIRNTASAHDLEIGPGTPISTEDGTKVAVVVGQQISIPPGQMGTLALSAPLAVGQSLYLGANSSGKPSIRQMFICPGGPPPGVPNVPTVPTPDQSLPTE